MTSTTEDVMAYESNCGLKKDVGTDFSINTLISEAQLIKCEELMDQATIEFFNDAAPDLQALKQLTPGNDPTSWLRYAHNIRSLAKLLGFTLITDTCMHIVDTVSSNKVSPEKKSALLSKLVQTLDLCFQQKVRDDGGAVGKEVRDKLASYL